MNPCLACKGIQACCCQIASSASPITSPLEKIWTSGTEEKNRHIRDAIGQVLKQVKQHLVCPLEIVDHQDKRLSLCYCFEQDAPRTHYRRLRSSLFRAFTMRAALNISHLGVARFLAVSSKPSP